MENKELLHAMGEIEDRFVEEAAPVVKKKHTWPRWAAMAACLVLVVGLLAWPLLQGKPTPHNGRYQYTVTQQEAVTPVLRWEDRTLGERYLEMRLGDIRYCTRSLAIDASYLGEELGTCDAWGYDHYSEQTYHQSFAVYAIQGIQNERLVAVRMEDHYYVFRQDAYAPPATLGELLESYDLANHLSLNRFSKDDGYYALEGDAAIWQILAQCADAPVVETDDFRVTGPYLSFTATSEALGCYKRELYITEDGYLKTNLLDYGYVYYIGQEAAGQIIGYALANATETDMEPYTNFVAGTITEMGDGYILVNDAVLCWNEADGIEYKVLTQDPVFSRWFRYYDLQVGDVVYIQYRGEMAEGNLISGAYTICEAILQDGHVLVQG